MDTFYLGTHRVNWLGRVDVPLFVSRRGLAPRRRLPVATGRWALDSGGFTELSLFGGWTITPAQYAAEIRRFRDEIGGLDFAAPMDHMCEPSILARTGRTVRQHQTATVENYLDLAARDVPVMPVLQGWAREDYLRHVDDYARAGVDLFALPRVGLGTVCRRQRVSEGRAVVEALAGLRLHGFGFKLTGLRAVADLFASADSMAWSYNARRNPPRPDCAHRNCTNCLPFALAWRERVLRACAAPQQGVLFPLVKETP
jgi:hypothetical protein